MPPRLNRCEVERQTPVDHVDERKTFAEELSATSTASFIRSREAPHQTAARRVPRPCSHASPEESSGR